MNTDNFGEVMKHPEVDQSLEYAEEQLKFWAARVTELRYQQREIKFLTLPGLGQHRPKRQRTFFTGNLEYRPN